MPSFTAVALLLAGVALVIVGADAFFRGLLALAARRSLPAFIVTVVLSGFELLLGNTAVAASVEAEELARVALPARRGRSDVALANVLGTVVHFIAFNAGVIALVQPLPLDAATRHLHLPAALVSTAALCTLLATRGGLGRVEGGILLALYAAYLALALTALSI